MKKIFNYLNDVLVFSNKNTYVPLSRGERRKIERLKKQYSVK